MMFKRLAAAVCAAALSGCSTYTYSLKINDVDASLSDLKQVITSVIPGGIRTISTNGREYVSKHFLPAGTGQFRPSGDALERYFAHVLVLGDRRPYDLEIVVNREERVLQGNRFMYKVTGYDSRLAKELERRIHQELTKRREDRNIIDDFRVF